MSNDNKKDLEHSTSDAGVQEFGSEIPWPTDRERAAIPAPHAVEENLYITGEKMKREGDEDDGSFVAVTQDEAISSHRMDRGANIVDQGDTQPSAGWGATDTDEGMAASDVPSTGERDAQVMDHGMASTPTNSSFAAGQLERGQHFVRPGAVRVPGPGGRDEEDEDFTWQQSTQADSHPGGEGTASIPPVLEAKLVDDRIQILEENRRLRERITEMENVLQREVAPTDHTQILDENRRLRERVAQIENVPQGKGGPFDAVATVVTTKSDKCLSWFAKHQRFAALFLLVLVVVIVAVVLSRVISQDGKDASSKPEPSPSPTIIVPSSAPSFQPTVSPRPSFGPSITPQPTDTLRPTLGPTTTLMPSFAPSAGPSSIPTFEPIPTVAPPVDSGDNTALISVVVILGAAAALIGAVLCYSRRQSRESWFAKRRRFGLFILLVLVIVVVGVVLGIVIGQDDEVPSSAPPPTVSPPPTFGTFVESPDNYMTIDGMTPFGESEGRVGAWQNITSDHIMSFWNMREDSSGVDVFISRVETKLKDQDLVDPQVTRTFYSQNMWYSLGGHDTDGGLGDLEPEVLNVILAERPFATDFQRYADTLARFGVTDTALLELVEIRISQPSPNTSNPGALIGTIAGVVLGLLLIAGGVWYYRKRRQEKALQRGNEEFIGDSPSEVGGNTTLPQDAQQNITQPRPDMPLTPSGGASTSDVMDTYSENASELSFHAAPEGEAPSVSGDDMEDADQRDEDEDS